MMNQHTLAQRLFNTPIALHSQAGELIRSNASLVLQNPRAYFGNDDSPRPPGLSLVNGVAIIDVKGILLKDDPGWWGVTGYDWVRMCIGVAIEDPDVKAILLLIDSPGGEVAGCFDLTDAIYKARGIKPIWSILTESAYSAAYSIASATDRIIVPRTGGTGSVGTICMCVDFSKALSAAGIAVTMIHYGDRKADGHPEIPLSKEALARFQSDIDVMGELFVETVARNRGLKASAVRATQATTYLGAQGVEIGFADAVMAPDEAFRSLLEELGQ
jgi:signal peptide peptidase SppA